MQDLARLWNSALPEIRNAVTGKGVWQALNSAVPVAFEEGVLVIGLPLEQATLAGHLKTPQAQSAIEREIGARLKERVHVRVIDGATTADWELAKRKDEETRRLQQASLERKLTERSASSDWDAIYDQLARRFAATPNKSLAQNRAAFYRDAVALLSAAVRSNPIQDDLAERNLARCIDRVAQYADVPGTIVALHVTEPGTA